MLTKLIISEYLIKSTGADGGHKYISTEIELEGKVKKLTILFAKKSDENKLENSGLIKLKGELQNDGGKDDLIMNNATLEK